MWPPEDKEPPEMMEGREREEQYRVAVDWFYDMEDYNEWMFEEDYEVTSYANILGSDTELLINDCDERWRLLENSNDKEHL